LTEKGQHAGVEAIKKHCGYKGNTKVLILGWSKLRVQQQEREEQAGECGEKNKESLDLKVIF